MWAGLGTSFVISTMNYLFMYIFSSELYTCMYVSCIIPKVQRNHGFYAPFLQYNMPFFNPLFSLCEHRQNAAFCLQGKNWIFGIIMNLFLNFFWLRYSEGYSHIYRPFHKTLPRSSAFVNWISVSFYETAGCTCICGISLTWPGKWNHVYKHRKSN